MDREAVRLALRYGKAGGMGGGVMVLALEGAPAETSLQLGLGELRGQMKGRRMVQQFQGHLAEQNHARPSGS